MADPHLTPTLDPFDRFTVSAYRTGFVASGLGLGATGVLLAQGSDVRPGHAVIWIGMALSAGNLHVYAKRFRWTMQWLAWSGILLVALSGAWAPADSLSTLGFVGHGLVLAAVSSVVLKEWFCFRIPLVRFTPAVLAISVLAEWLARHDVAAACYVLGGVATLTVAVAKLRMPLGHDIGDRGAYQV